MDRPLLLAQLASLITAVQREHPTRVAIDGVDGAGKTTLANELAQTISDPSRKVIRASVDDFQTPRSLRYGRGRESAEGYFKDTFNYVAFHEFLLDPLSPGGSRRLRSAFFDWRTDSPIDSPIEQAGDRDILICDGVFLLRDELVAWWDFRIWVQADFAITVERGIERDAVSEAQDTAHIRHMYSTRYTPGQHLYIERCRPRERAHVIVYNDHPGAPRMELRAPA